MIAAIYARKSTDDGGDSTARQIEHAQAYAEKKGWTVSAHIYEDTGISGAEFENRPGLQKLLSTLKPGPPFSVLIMSEESRLGRELFEVGWRLKQLSVAGVRVFLYLQDRELTINSATEKLLLSVENFAAEVERERSRERTHDSLSQKAKLGHVTGGKVYGYRNHPVIGPDGKRSHVELVIDPKEAEIVKDIFKLYASGKGGVSIAKELNLRGVAGPRSAWASSSVREILCRTLYRGERVWNKVKKRDKWGHKKYEPRPEDEWIHAPMPELRIVPDELWERVQNRLAEARETYLRRANGQLWGRPTRGVEGKYLLSSMAQCTCGGSIVVATHGSAGKRRVLVYKCGVCHTKGKSVCPNNLAVPLEATNQAVLAAIEEQVLQPGVIEAAIEQALEKLRPLPNTTKKDSLSAELVPVEVEIERLTRAIAHGGDMRSLVAALKEKEKQREHFESELRGLEQLEQIADLDLDAIRDKLRERLQDWAGLLHRHPSQARQILRKLLVGRLTFTPHEDEQGRYYVITGECSGGKLLEGVVFKRSTATGGTLPGLNNTWGAVPPSRNHVRAGWVKPVAGT